MRRNYICLSLDAMFIWNSLFLYLFSLFIYIYTFDGPHTMIQVTFIHSTSFVHSFIIKSSSMFSCYLNLFPPTYVHSSPPITVLPWIPALNQWNCMLWETFRFTCWENGKFFFKSWTLYFRYWWSNGENNLRIFNFLF